MKNLENHVAGAQANQADAVPQHTPGPWKSFNITFDPRCGSIRGEGGEAVALMPNWLDSDPMDELRANAHLIAAAPDMYAALAEYVEIIDRVHLPDDDNVRKARAALRKARGE